MRQQIVLGISIVYRNWINKMKILKKGFFYQSFVSFWVYIVSSNNNKIRPCTRSLSCGPYGYLLMP